MAAVAAVAEVTRIRHILRSNRIGVDAEEEDSRKASSLTVRWLANHNDQDVSNHRVEDHQLPPHYPIQAGKTWRAKKRLSAGWRRSVMTEWEPLARAQTLT